MNSSIRLASLPVADLAAPFFRGLWSPAFLCGFSLRNEPQFHLLHVFQADFGAGTRGGFAEQLFAALAHGQQSHDAFVDFDYSTFQCRVVNPHRASDADECVERHQEATLGLLRLVVIFLVALIVVVVISGFRFLGAVAVGFRGLQGPKEERGHTGVFLETFRSQASPRT